MSSTDAGAVQAFLAIASRRIAWLKAARSATIGLTLALDIALVVALLGWSRAFGNTAAIVGGSLAAAGLGVGIAIAMVHRQTAFTSAAEVERRAPECRNIVITAAELIAAPDRVKPYVAAMVSRDAAVRVRSLDIASLFPARRTLGTLAAISAVWIIVLTVVAARDSSTTRWIGDSSTAPSVPAIEGVEVTVTPPPYSGRPAQVLRNPSRIDALAGSRILVAVQTDAASVTVETLDGRQALASSRTKTRVFDLTANADGFIAIEPSGPSGTGTRRLIGLTVSPDHPPRVRVTTPGKDMFLADAKRSIDVVIEADDDLALASITLRYIRVSGSGERFTFVEGNIPVSITRADGATWKARGTLNLASLRLEKGDMVVYRGIATDRRPGATPAESDAFLIEITSPGMLAADGFSLDDQQDKYALSQQMVILKTERLLARAPTLPPESVTYHSQLIAAEQRAVRAEFVFMMGGEVAEEVIAAAAISDINEEEEAASEADLGAGRMVNRGRVSLIQAIRLMSRASALLNGVDPAKALPEEKAALVSLQQAFSRTRYLLRALTQRERLDLSRRMTGVLEAAGPQSRPVATPALDPRAAALRRTLAGIAALAGEDPFAVKAAASLSMLAQSVLQADPSSEPLQQIANQLNDAASAIDRERYGDARRQLGDAATQLAGVLRARLVSAPAERPPAELARLRGELADAIRRSRGGR